MARARFGPLTVLAAVAALLAAGAYAYADVRDVVPGPLTTTPAPQEYPDLLPAPGADPPTPEEPAPDPGGQHRLDPQAPAPTRAGLQAVLGPALTDPALGPNVSAVVMDVRDGQVLYTAAPDLRVEPASVAKILTAAAALRVLGPDSRLATSTVLAPGGVLYLVGTGDVLLGSGAGAPDGAQGRAGLGDLAARTATRLRGEGVTEVTLRLDDSLLGGLGWGEAMGPGTGEADVSAGFVAPVTGLAVNAGRTADTNYAPRLADPGLAAATVLARALTDEGITVTGDPTRERVPRQGQTVATVESAPMSQVVGFMLDHSDNNVAENLSRLVAVRAGNTPGFASGGAAVLAQITGLGLDTRGSVLADGSGLSDGSRLSAALLAQVLVVAGSPEHPQLRPLLTGLPVGGLTGTLTDRFRPDAGAGDGVGRVRAKTGTLTGVSALAGVLVTADGRQVAFAFLADRVPATATGRAALDRASVALLSCGCR